MITTNNQLLALFRSELKIRVFEEKKLLESYEVFCRKEPDVEAFYTQYRRLTIIEGKSPLIALEILGQPPQRRNAVRLNPAEAERVRQQILQDQMKKEYI